MASPVYIQLMRMKGLARFRTPTHPTRYAGASLHLFHNQHFPDTTIQKMLFAPVALLIGLAAAVLPTQAIELAPPDHVQVHYPNGTIAEGSNFTIGLDPPAFAANYSGFHYIANISAQFPDGSIHDLLNISSLSCHGEEIYNETLEASGNGLYNVSLKATEEGK